MQAPLLDREHEYDLARRWRYDGDKDALDELITAYIRFAVRIASGFRGYGLPLGDLVQEGNVGLMQAAERFDPEHKVRFSTYASWWIMASIQDFVLRNSSIVRVATTPSQRRLFFNLRRARARYATGPNGTMVAGDRARVAAALNVKQAEVERMETHLSVPDISLNATIGSENSDEELQNMLVDKRPLPADTVTMSRDAQTRSRWLHAALDTLNPREVRIIASRFLEEDKRTLADIGHEMGVSKERIRQLEAKALTKLRDALETMVDTRGDFFSA